MATGLRRISASLADRAIQPSANLSRVSSLLETRPGGVVASDRQSQFALEAEGIEVSLQNSFTFPFVSQAV